MVSIVVHFLLGLGCIAWIIASNPKVYARPAGGPWLSPLECVYYAAGIASIIRVGEPTHNGRDFLKALYGTGESIEELEAGQSVKHIDYFIHCFRITPST